jgi:hypothetical protein
MSSKTSQTVEIAEVPEERAPKKESCSDLILECFKSCATTRIVLVKTVDPAPAMAVTKTTVVPLQPVTERGGKQRGSVYRQFTFKDGVGVWSTRKTDPAHIAQAKAGI